MTNRWEIADVTQPGMITFTQQGDPPREVFRVEPDGRFFVGDREVETSEEVRDLFAEFCRSWFPHHKVDTTP